MIKRILYLGYYLKQLERNKYGLFLNYASSKSQKSKFKIVLDSVYCVFKYNIGLMDYFLFRFYEKDHSDRSKWVGTGYKYEYDLIMNPKNTRHILENKIEFYKTYSPFVYHAYCTIDDLKLNNDKANRVLSNPTGKIVIKDALGQCGWNIELIELNNKSREEIINLMNKKGFNLAEEFIQQHPALSEISSTGLNTIRVITQLDKNNHVDILGALLRISVNNFVDNLASGNIAAPIDLATGRVNGPAVYSDITKEAVEYHPATKSKITGIQIPQWDRIIELVTKAALYRPENRSVGWDVALTERGPELIEGNHNWCKILWQLPVNSGLKHILENYLK